MEGWLCHLGPPSGRRSILGFTLAAWLAFGAWQSLNWKPVAISNKRSKWRIIITIIIYIYIYTCKNTYICMYMHVCTVHVHAHLFMCTHMCMPLLTVSSRRGLLILMQRPALQHVNGDPGVICALVPHVVHFHLGLNTAIPLVQQMQVHDASDCRSKSAKQMLKHMRKRNDTNDKKQWIILDQDC